MLHGLTCTYIVLSRSKTKKNSLIFFRINGLIALVYWAAHFFKNVLWSADKAFCGNVAFSCGQILSDLPNFFKSHMRVLCFLL